MEYSFTVSGSHFHISMKTDSEPEILVVRVGHRVVRLELSGLLNQVA